MFFIDKIYFLSVLFFYLKKTIFKICFVDENCNLAFK